MEQGQKVYSLDVARVKIQKYCAYQERCHKEVSDKLYSFGLGEEARNMLTMELMQDNYLNEERFAQAYVSGKFRIKKWGKTKIKLKLKEKRVSAPCIAIGLKEIDYDEYLKTLNDVIEHKWHLTKETNAYKKKGKVASYAYSRGFESALIWEALEEYE